MISAVFFPSSVPMHEFDLRETAAQAHRAGLKLYTDGQRFALLSRLVAGWALWGGKTK